MQSTPVCLSKIPDDVSTCNCNVQDRNESGLLSCFLASPTLRAALVKSSWLMYSLQKEADVVSLALTGPECFGRCSYRSSLMANMPASVMTFRRSAPLNPSESCTQRNFHKYHKDLWDKRSTACHVPLQWPHNQSRRLCSQAQHGFSKSPFVPAHLVTESQSFDLTVQDEGALGQECPVCWSP